MFIAVMLVAFIIRDCVYAGYEFFFSSNSYDVMECLNLSYRALVLAAFTEEFLYRGVIYDEMKIFFKPITAAVIQSLLFTFVHAERWISLFISGDLYIAVNLLLVFFMGIMCAFYREKTGSLVPGIFVHFALNGGVFHLFLALFSV